jgi:hypothetical protein
VRTALIGRLVAAGSMSKLENGRDDVRAGLKR